MKSTIVLAAGKGTRMKSTLNKVMHPALNKPMTGHVVDTLKAGGVERIATVVGHDVESVEECLRDSVEYAIQQSQLGTGCVVIQVSVLEGLDGDTIVINGDGPCIQREAIQKVFESSRDAACTVLTNVLSDGGHYGRIIRNTQGTVERIVEVESCNGEELEAKEINTGIFRFNNEALFEGLKEIANSNAQQEYYLTDLTRILNKKDLCISAMIVDDPKETMGVSDRMDLAKANAWMKCHINEVHARAGVTIIDPDSTYIDVGATIGEGTVVYPSIHVQGRIVIGKNTAILPNSLLCNAVIGDNIAIGSSKIVKGSVGGRSAVEPMSHLRNNAEIREDCRIENFVEFKNSHSGDGSKCAHLTYTGDSDFGKKINVSCGVVTVNYNDRHKFYTAIHDGAFTRNNCNLIAPVIIGEDALLAAGSTIADSVDDGDMGAVKARQSIKKGFGTTYKNKQERNRIVEQWKTEQ